MNEVSFVALMFNLHEWDKHKLGWLELEKGTATAEFINKGAENEKLQRRTKEAEPQTH